MIIRFIRGLKEIDTMTKESKPGKDVKAAKPERKAPPQPAYVQFQGGFQSGRNKSGSAGQVSGASSPIRRGGSRGGGGGGGGGSSGG
ncbi:MAG: hypothetical protein EYC62_09165 [Alphaproteobacteria bacterium]|nr:MAG: hypothetical protein EYC62_09165 [Alphaproteobacteria bacterium]